MLKDTKMPDMCDLKKWQESPVVIDDSSSKLLKGSYTDASLFLAMFA